MRLALEKWKMLVIAFREQPANWRNASRMACCDKLTAKKAWFDGYPDRGLKPIKEMVEGEREEKEALAKAKSEVLKIEMEEFASNVRKDVRAQALEEYERTNRYLRAASATATATLVAVHRLQPTVQELGNLAPQLLLMIEKDLAKGDLTASQAMNMLERIASFTKSVATTANEATAQGAKVFAVGQSRNSSDAIINIEKAVVSEPFDPAEAKRLAAELAEAALEAEELVNTPALKVLSSLNQQPQEEEEAAAG